MSDSLLNILINAKDNASAAMKGLGSTMEQVKSQTQSLASSGLEQLNKGLEVTANIIKTSVIVGVIGLTTALGALGANAIQSTSDFQKQMIVLDLTAQKYGLNTEKAQELAQVLGKDLRIGTSSAGESLQYLIKSGLTLDQSSDLLRRFTNEAITGKSSSIDLATAVKNLAFAYTTGNSALGNMSGVSENFTDIEKKGLVILQQKGQLLGLTVKQLDEAQKMQARYAGMIDLTNLTMGSSERLQGTFSDNLLAIQSRFNELQIELGQRFLPILGVLSDGFLRFIENIGITNTINQITTAFSDLMAYLQPVFDFLIQNPLILQAVFIGLAGVIGTLVVGALFSLASAVIVAMAPFIVLGTIIGLLFVAWQTNFLGIRDVTQNVLQFVGNGLSSFATFFLQNLDTIINGIFETVNGISSNFNSLINFFRTNVFPVLGVFLDFFGVVFGGIVKISSNSMADLISVIGQGLQFLMPFITPILQGMVSVFGNVFKNIVLVVEGATGIIRGIMSGDLKQIVAGAIDLFGGLAGAVASIFDGIQTTINKVLAGVIQKVIEVMDNDFVKKGLEVAGMGGAIGGLQSLKSSLEKNQTGNADGVKGMVSGLKNFLDIPENKQAENRGKAIDDTIAGINSSLANLQANMTKIDFVQIANQIRNGGSSIGDFVAGLGKNAKDQLSKLGDKDSTAWMLDDSQRSALRDVTSKAMTYIKDFGNSMKQAKTEAVKLPNIMEGAIGMLEGAKSSLTQAEQAQKTKDQADAQKSIIEDQKKAISSATGGEKDGKGKKEETQAEKDLKVLKAQLDIIKDKANLDIEALQRQKESLQYEESKARLTEASILMDTTKSDALEQQLKALEEQKLTLNQLDPLDKAGKQQKDDQLEAMQRMLVAKRDEIELAKQSEQTTYKEAQNTKDKAQKERDLAQLELDKQIQDRKNKLIDESRPLEQKIANITINVQTLPNQSNEDIAQQVSQILAQQYNTA